MGRVGEEAPNAQVTCFFEMHFLRIMNEIRRVTDKHSIDKKDIVLEIDFEREPNETRSPADKGEFLVYPVSQVLQEARDPSWYHPWRGTKKHDLWMSSYTKNVQDMRRRITSNTMILIVVNTNAGGNCGRFAFANQGGFVLTSDQALHMFPVTTLAEAKRVLKQAGYKEAAIPGLLKLFQAYGGGNK